MFDIILICVIFRTSYSFLKGKKMVGLGFIGFGGHAQHHAAHLGQMGVMAGVWDPNEALLNTVPPHFRFESIEALLAAEYIDAVVICSPDEFHLEQMEMALRAGKHVFCEKPLIVPGQPIERLIGAFELAKEKNLVITSCHPRRYDRPFLWLLDKVSPKADNPELLHRFGQPISVDYDFSYHKPSSEWKHGRSLMLDHLNHEVDIVNCLFGIQSFSAMKLTDSHDYYHVIGQRDDGIIFRFMGTRALEAHSYHEWCRVRFARGEVEMDMMRGVARVVDHESSTVEEIPELGIDYDSRLTKIMNDFTDCQIIWEQSGYLKPQEMLMNAEVGIVLANGGWQRVNVRTF